MRVLWIELRRSPMLYAAPLLVFAGAYVYEDRNALGDGQWPSVLSSLNWSLILLGPLTAGVTAWIGGREKRRGMRSLRVTSTRRGSTVVLPQIVATIVWVEASIAIIIAYAVVTHVSQGIWGMPSALWLAKIAVGAASFVPAPFVLGWLLAHRFMPPLVAIASFVGIGIVVSYFRVQWLYVLLPLPATSGTIWFRLNEAVMAGQILWLVAVTVLPVAVLALYVDRSDRRTARWPQASMSVGAAAAAAVGIALIVSHGSRIYTTEDARYTPVCDSTGALVCGHPAYSSQLSAISERAALLQARLADTPGRFDSLVQRFTAGEPAIGQGTPPSFAISSSQPGFANISIEQLVDQSFMPACYETDESSAAFPLQRAVVGWLGSASKQYVAEIPSGVPDSVSKAVRTFNSLSEQARRQWLDAHYTSIEQCRATAQMFR